jgi:hypothetical protein
MEAILCVHEMERERAAARFAVKPQLSAYTGMTLATVAPMHLVEPKPCSRTALMELPIVTRADALAADGEDRNLNQRPIGSLRLWRPSCQPLAKG